MAGQGKMTREEMRARTKAFALRVIKMVDSLPRGMSADEMGRQVLRSGMSVGANYRAALLGRSKKEFLSKLGIVEEEADESAFWMELLIESGKLSETKAGALRDEAYEILSIVVASNRTGRGRN